MATLKFMVDAKLLQELGERLVGRPYIALGELIKNSYDADARNVELAFDNDSIRVTDDGLGMDEVSFRKRWMRIGTTVKADELVSPVLQRPLTGSKGVGRLAAQLLASSLELRSVALRNPLDRRNLFSDDPATGPEIAARIDWPVALDQENLTDVSVDFDVSSPSSMFANASPHGTSILLRGLTTTWNAEQFEALAREVWALQPPFTAVTDPSTAFTINLTTPFPDVQKSFDDQMRALMSIADATVKGRLLRAGEEIREGAERIVLPTKRSTNDQDGEIELTTGAPLSLQVDDADGPSLWSKEQEGTDQTTEAPSRQLLLNVSIVGAPNQEFLVEIPDCQLDSLELEIRVFDLVYRQPRGIKVDVARSYLATFGGVNLYDNGFRLPYYGPEIDWLRLELDHARRLSRSQLVPEHLQVRNAMQNLPSNKRVFGVANISTSHEAQAAMEQGRRVADALAIQITRDRLVDNRALDQLTGAVRLGIDLYALARTKAKARRVLEPKRRPRTSPSIAVQDASDVVESVREQLPSETYQSLRDSIDTLATDVAARTTEARAYASLLGALATAGMTSLAYEHEVSKQRGEVTEVARQLNVLADQAPDGVRSGLEGLSERLSAWAQRSNRIRALFRPLLDEESRTIAGRYSAKKVTREVVRTIEVLARTTDIDTSEIPATLLLPTGTSAAWSAILQNLLTNAFRATLTSKPARVTIDGGHSAKGGWLRVQDNGVGGVDLKTADRLFMPFERGMENSQRAEALGLGGSGLGLTIVRMITDEIGCRVAFEKPEEGWSTAVRIVWEA